MIFADRQVVPALMFHSVGLTTHQWVWSGLSEPIETFEAKLKFLKDRGYTTIFWSDLVDHVTRSRPAAPNSIMLTFDDGYLDNWVLVYPLLRKYGMCATIFVSTDFIDPGAEPRKTLESVWRKECEYDDLQRAGFLRVSELTTMCESGIIDIQSHAMSHSWQYSSNRVIDYYRQENSAKYPWLAWNLHPERKPFYLNEDQSKLVPVGTPVFGYDCAMIARRFLPDLDAVGNLLKFVSDYGGEEFFSRENWQDVLCRQYLEPNGLTKEWPGRWEEAQEHQERLNSEIREAKRILEETLKREIRFLSWPNGAYDELAAQTAVATGFQAWTLSSHEQRRYRNRPGGDARILKRMNTDNPLKVCGVRCRDQGALFLYLKVRAHQDSLFWKLILNGYKLFCVTESLLFRRK